MNRKVILFGGRSAVLVCDGRCDKAWGINKRPRLYFQESLTSPRALAPGEQPRDPDDTVYLGDAELGTAPEDPGTYEGDHGKPSAVPLTDPSRMNKWCARECERSAVLEPGENIVAPNLTQPKPNIPRPVKKIMKAILCSPCFRLFLPSRPETIGANPTGHVECFGCGKKGDFDGDDFHEVPLEMAKTAKRAWVTSAVLTAAQTVADAWDAAVVNGDPSAILRNIALDALSAAVTEMRKL